MSWRLCLCVAVVTTALPLTFSSTTVTPKSKEQQTGFRESPTELSSTGMNEIFQEDRNEHQSEVESSLKKEPGADKNLSHSEGVGDNDVDGDADQAIADNHFYNNVEDETTQTSDYENALAAFPGVVSTLHDPDTYNWLLSYLPVKLPKLPETFSLKSKYKNLLYGYLKSANRVVVGNDNIKNAVASANLLFSGYNDSQVYLYSKLALDAFQDYYVNKDGAALRDRLDRVLHDFENEEFQRRLLERLDWWAPFGEVLWGQVSQVSQQMGWTSSERQLTRPATDRHTYKKWSDTLKDYINKSQSWTSRVNTLLQSTGRLHLPNVNFATVSDHTAAASLLPCSGCVANNKGNFIVNLTNLFFFLSALLAPILLVALPIALAVWLAIVYGIKFKYLANGFGGAGHGGGHGGGYGGGYYSEEGGYDDSYRRTGYTGILGNLGERIGNMMADSFINWGGTDSPKGGQKKKVRVSHNRNGYSDEYALGGHNHRGDANGGEERQRQKTEYRQRSRPKADTVYYDNYQDYNVEDHAIS